MAANLINLLSQAIINLTRWESRSADTRSRLGGDSEIAQTSWSSVGTTDVRLSLKEKKSIGLSLSKFAKSVKLVFRDQAVIAGEKENLY